MGRHRKIEVNAVVQRADGSHWTVVLYNHESTSNRYGCIETDSLGRWPRGWLRMLDSSELTPTGRKSVMPGRIYRANLREGTPEERGCGCQCCKHVAGYDEG